MNIDTRFDTSELRDIWAARNGPPIDEGSPEGLAVWRARCDLCDIDAAMVGWADGGFLRELTARGVVEFSAGVRQ